MADPYACPHHDSGDTQPLTLPPINHLLIVISTDTHRLQVKHQSDMFPPLSEPPCAPVAVNNHTNWPFHDTLYPRNATYVRYWQTWDVF